MAYKTPSKAAFRNRKRFHATQKSNSESISDWFKRLQKFIGDCDFDEIYDSMLIDKFLSGLNENDFEKISLVPVWTVDELILVAIGNAHIFNTKDTKPSNGNLEIRDIDSNVENDENHGNANKIKSVNIKSEDFTVSRCLNEMLSIFE